MKQDGPKINPDLTFRRNSVFSQAVNIAFDSIFQFVAKNTAKALRAQNEFKPCIIIVEADIFPSHFA